MARRSGGHPPVPRHRHGHPQRRQRPRGGACGPPDPAVYVDNDPIVLAHAHELLDAKPDATAYIHGDLFQPETILAKAGALLDLDQPVAVVLNAVLHHIPERDDPYAVVARLMDGVASGSYLAMSHLTDDLQSEEMRALSQSVPRDARYTFAVRSRADFARFFEGLSLVEPGIVPIDQWRPTSGRSPRGPLPLRRGRKF